MTRLSLTARITLLLGAAAVLLLGGAALTMDQMVDTEISQRMDAGLLTQAQTLASLVELGPSGLDMDEFHKPRRQLLAGQTVEFWSVRCISGPVIISQPAPPVYPAHWQTTAHDQPAFANLGHGHHPLRAVWFTFTPNAGEGLMTERQTGVTHQCAMVFMHSRDAMDDILSVIDEILLLVPLLAVVAVLLLSPVLVHHGLKPLSVLGGAMHNIGPHASGQRLDVTGTRELEPLVARFNEVLKRMDEGMARERQFAGALAHETRTHLAELRVLVEVEQRYPSGRPAKETLAEIGHIVEELQGTVSGLLLLTRLEAGIEGMNPGKVRLDEVIDRHLESLADRLHKRKLHLDRETPMRGIVLIADPALLDIIIGNLLGNATAYAPFGSTLGIRLHAQTLIVDNEAPDLDADEVTRFGQRFWSKHHGTEGHVGLGLALAGTAATAMNLELHFTLDVHRHLQATLSWPTNLVFT